MLTSMLLVYIAAPYTATEDRTVAENIAYARNMGVKVAEQGHYPVMPQSNTAHFEDFPSLVDIPAKFWYEGTALLMRKCDVVLFARHWHQSQGCRSEHALAMILNIPIIVEPHLPAKYLF